MIQQQKIYEASVDISARRADVFGLLNDADAVGEILGVSIVNKMKYKDDTANGTVIIDGSIFEAWSRPYDIDLRRNELRIRFRVAQEGVGCRLMAVVLCHSKMAENFSNKIVESILVEIKNYVDSHKGALPRQPGKKSILRRNKTKREDSVETVKSTVEGDEDVKVYQRPAMSPARRRSVRRFRIIAALLVISILCGIVYLGIKIADGLNGRKAERDLSAKVTVTAALSLSTGMSRNDISYTLGTNGCDTGDKTYIYRSERTVDNGIPAVQIAVKYGSGNKADSITCLDLETVFEDYDVGSPDISFASGSTVEDIVAAVGSPASMYRIYDNEGGEQITELHFGYLDPFANFNSAWRGEYIVALNGTSGAITSESWYPVDPADEMPSGQLDGTALGNQFDDYTDYLCDKYEMEHIFLLIDKKYTRGDAEKVVGTLTQYTSSSGLNLFVSDSERKLESDEPRLRISIGYDFNGQLRAAAITDMALINRSGMLADSNSELVTRGMSYKDIKHLMGVLPTAIRYDGEYINVCYGRRLESDVPEEQFELIVKLNPQTMQSESVLLNTGVAKVQDSAGAA